MIISSNTQLKIKQVIYYFYHFHDYLKKELFLLISMIFLIYHRNQYFEQIFTVLFLLDIKYDADIRLFNRLKSTTNFCLYLENENNYRNETKEK